jgi:ParB-like chromosome segregation protein Spo0J
MNAAFVRPAKHMFVAIDEIDHSHAIRPYNATVVAELAQSIRAIGLQTPLTCVIRDGRHILVTGRNRLEALRLVGAEQAPVRIVDFDDIEAQLWRLSENLHRAELTKLQYDNQVVEYAELLKAKQAGETSAERQPGLSRQLGAVSGGELLKARQAEETVSPISPQQERQPQADKVRQLGAVSGGRGNTGGYREAARELHIPEQTVRRAYQTASLSPEAQEAAVEMGMDDNRSALHEAAKERTPEAQVEALERRADRAAAPIAPRPPALRNLENIAAGELARWIKLTTPNSRRHVIRLLQDCADILERELKGIADGPSKANGAGQTARATP